MSISEILENRYSNQVKNIKKVKDKKEKMMLVGSLVMDVGGRCILAISKALGCTRDFFTNSFEFVKNGCEEQLKLEFRGRKGIIEKFPNLISDIESIIENHKFVDSHFKTDTIFIGINPNCIINELIANYNYPEKFACYNSIRNILHNMGYKFHKIPKSMVQNKILETDLIFENVNEELQNIDNTIDEVAYASIDDKTTKKIGLLSDNGKTWEDIRALDHDTIFDLSLKPFGIYDLKTNETFVTCTPHSSTAEFKVDNIEAYIKYKNKKCKLKKLVIFLDNGPENSSRRKLWLKSLVNLSVKYGIVIRLVYYPPYHSKYNKIERYWARVQMYWNRFIIDTTEKFLKITNTITWKNVKSKWYINWKKYETGIIISDSEMEEINKHIIREEGLEKWSLVITPFTN